MATTYQYRLFDSEFGPVGFRDLVALVRDGTLSTDDLVKADWEDDWHPAAEVVGLFHMAGRQDVLEKWEAERRSRETAAAAGDLDEMLSQAEAIEDDQEPAWKKRWQQVQEQQRVAEVEKNQQRQQELAQARTQRRIGETISAAEEEFDRREAARRPGRIQQWKNALFSSAALHHVFRWGVTLAAANLVAFGILNWSETESQRYPERRNVAAQARVFPFWGECSTAEYMFLLCDAMIFAGAAGYSGARILESMADD